MFDVDVVDHARDGAAAARVVYSPFAPRQERRRCIQRVRRYSPRLPRTAIGALAAAMTAMTMFAFVMLPAALESAMHTLY